MSKATSRITFHNYQAQHTLFGRSNVINATNHNPIFTNYHLFLTLNNLTHLQPNWRFKAVDASPVVTDTVSGAVATQFTIYDGDEELGTVKITHHGSNPKIKVRNSRIDAKRSRGNGYFTEDPAKAELTIRKNFFRLNKNERVEKAEETARDVVVAEHRNKERTKRLNYSELVDRADTFVMEHIHDYLKANPNYEKRHSAYTTACAEADVTKSVRDALDNGCAVLVALDGAQYFVKVGKEMKTCEDADLSFDLRKKIGLLKLVEDKQMISDVGCRVDSTTFVLLPEVKEQE